MKKILFAFLALAVVFLPLFATSCSKKSPYEKELEKAEKEFNKAIKKASKAADKASKSLE